MQGFLYHGTEYTGKGCCPPDGNRYPWRPKVPLPCAQGARRVPQAVPGLLPVCGEYSGCNKACGENASVLPLLRYPGTGSPEPTRCRPRRHAPEKKKNGRPEDKILPPPELIPGNTVCPLRPGNASRGNARRPVTLLQRHMAGFFPNRGISGILVVCRALF